MPKARAGDGCRGFPQLRFCSAVEPHVFFQTVSPWDPVYVREEVRSLSSGLGRGVQRPPQPFTHPAPCPCLSPILEGPRFQGVTCPVPSCPASTRVTFSTSQDMFVAAVSLVTGKTLYISDQVASIFHCKRDAFYNAKFVEFLAPHDVSVFHSSTIPYKLPPWSDRRQAGEGPSPWAARGGLSPAGWGPGRATPDVGPLPTSPPLDSAAVPQCALQKGLACL